MADKNGDNSPSDVEKKIITQMEYYFGNMNLPRDRFLQDQITQDDGWVLMEQMLKFNRLNKLTEDGAVIGAALKKSTSGLMEVSEDCTKVRRSPSMPIPDNTKERRDEISSRTVYVKGFPLEYTLDKAQEYFAGHGKIESIQMRRLPKTKDFKGSVFVVFEDNETAATFMKLEAIKCEEKDLTKMLKDDYFKKKTEERKDSKKKVVEKSKKEQEADDENIQSRIKSGTILKLEGLPTETSLEDVRNFFSDFGQVAWVDLEKGETKGYVRFREENEATEVLVKAKEAGDGKIEINNNSIEAKVLDGEEELNHWKMIFKASDAKKSRPTSNRGGFRGGRRGGSRGGSHFGYKGKKRVHRDKGDGEPAAKVKKD